MESMIDLQLPDSATIQFKHGCPMIISGSLLAVYIKTVVVHFVV